MSWIDEIIKVHNEYFEDSFNKLGLRKYEEMDGPGMGALIKFKNVAFKLQIINDRGLLETEISPLFGNEQFRSIEKFNSLLEMESISKNISELEKKKILNTRLDFVKQNTFLFDNHERLKNLLDKKNYTDTLKKIEALR